MKALRFLLVAALLFPALASARASRLTLKDTQKSLIKEISLVTSGTSSINISNKVVILLTTDEYCDIETKSFSDSVALKDAIEKAKRVYTEDYSFKSGRENCVLSIH